MRKHTKGPWRVTDEYLDYLKKPTFSQAPEAIVGPNGEIVVASSEWLDLNEDDARLIAAAPELLDALADVLGWIPGSHFWHTAAPSAAVEKARSIIAKATGEPQA